MNTIFEQYCVNKTQQGPEEEFVGKMKEEENLELMDTLRSLRAEIRDYKEDNKNIVREQEEVNVILM